MDHVVITKKYIPNIIERETHQFTYHEAEGILKLGHPLLIWWLPLLTVSLKLFACFAEIFQYLNFFDDLDIILILKNFLAVF